MVIRVSPERGLWRGHNATDAQLKLFEQQQIKPTTQTGKLTQADLLLFRLRQARANHSVLPLPEIMRAGIAQHGARFNELRRAGFQIQNELTRVNGSVHSVYRLVFDPELDPAVQP
jgi:hypothetical protein